MLPQLTLAQVSVVTCKSLIRFLVLALFFIFPLSVTSNPVVTEHTQELISGVAAIQPGVPADIQRIVAENCQTLRFRAYGFEKGY
jgi:hypothetical protein